MAAAQRIRRRNGKLEPLLALIDELDASVISINADQTILSWSAGAQALYGWSAVEAVGRPAAALLIPADARAWTGFDRGERDRWQSEQIRQRKDGSTFIACVRSRATIDDEGLGAVVEISFDVSEQVTMDRRSHARAYLAAAMDHVGEGVYIQDEHGHLTYMNNVAQETLGWSLDELRGHTVHQIVHRRRSDGSEHAFADCPIRRAQVDRRTVRIDDDIFLRRDGTEMPVAYTAAPFETESGDRGCVVVFEDITERQMRARAFESDLQSVSVLAEIHEALAFDRFELFSQPIVELGSGEIVQRELLLRMRNPDGQSVIAPAIFIPVAEQAGLMPAIDSWVVNRSMELAAGGLAVELNVSACSIADPNFVQAIRDALRRTRADPAMVVVEITETAMLHDEVSGRKFVEQLHALGCRVALDDFGTGYGGFTYLKQLPIDFLKIDVEFVRDLPYSAASRSVVGAIVRLAQDFGLKTVAEGVEEGTTLDLLLELGVDYAQGYHIARPAPIESPAGVINC